jgi:hypothetical protein
MRATPARSVVAIAVALAAALVPAVTSLAVAAPPATPRASTTFRVVAHLSTHFVRIHHSVAIAGSVAPARGGQKVFLQQETEFDTWKTIDVTKLNAASEYSFSVTPIASGAKYYRVLKLRDRAVARAFSPIKRLNATRWFDLQAVPISQYDGFGLAVVTVDGVDYSGLSATLTGPGDLRTLIVDPGRTCTVLKGALGLDDSSDAGSSVDAFVATDRQIRFEATLTVGQPQTFRVPLTGVAHVEVQVYNNANTTAYPAIVGAQALCALQVIH